MRALFISLAAVASAVAVASPAAGQYYPQPQPYGAPYGNPYGAPYGNAYGYQNDWGAVRNLQARIHRLQLQIRDFDRRNILSDREADRLRREARDLEHRLVHFSRNGLSSGERFEIERRIAFLEQRVWREARDGRGWRREGSFDRQHDRWHDSHEGRGHRDDHDDD